MFAYSLSGLQIDESAAGAVLEVEENEITARSAVYQVLGRIFSPPDAEHAAKARDGAWVAELIEAAELLTLPWEVGAPSGPAADDAEHAAEYDKLFGVNDGTSPLWSGTYVEDRGQHQEELTRAYEYYGLGVPGEGIPVDSLSAELDYMQFLAFKEAASASPRLGKSFRRAQKDFLTRTLGIWVPSLVERSSGAGPFWSWALERLDLFVAADAAAD
jgi:DMSO reductase family type II enzyme chaperone